MSFLINPYAFLAAGGDFESIATVTVGSGGAAAIEFTSIPGTYQHLQLRVVGRTARTTTIDAMRLEINGNTTSADYAEHWLYGTGTSALAYGAASTLIGLPRVAGANASASVFGAIVVDILDYASTSKNKTVRSFGGSDNNGSGEVGVASGLFIKTDAITSLKVYGVTSTNWAQHSTAALYGIKAP